MCRENNKTGACAAQQVHIRGGWRSTCILKTNDDNSKLTEKRSVQLLAFKTEVERKENLESKAGGL